MIGEYSQQRQVSGHTIFLSRKKHVHNIILG